MITKNSVVKIQNLVLNHKSPPSKSNPVVYVFYKRKFTVNGNSQKIYFISAFYMFIFYYKGDVTIIY